MRASECNDRKTIAIIPARRGSVGIPGKNYKLTDGQPLIEYTIREAIKSELLDDVIVSTDCPEIIKICHAYGDRLTVLIRPSNLARDDSSSEQVVAHACDHYLKTQASIDKVVLLQPTSPVRSAEQIDESLRLLDAAGKMSLVSVTDSMQHPFDFVFEKDGDIQFLCRREKVFRRQDFIKTLFMNGAIYITKYDFFKKKKKIYDLKNCVLYKMPIESSIDIDTPFDLEICEFIIRKMKEKKWVNSI